MSEFEEIREKFILHWGEMATRWGISRSVAQIHALLFLSPDPLTADAIAEALGLARSNVSVSLKELQVWDLVSITHVLGDRRTNPLGSSSNNSDFPLQPVHAILLGLKLSQPIVVRSIPQ
jgi:DNA-binding MarR family transcriptional regulator